MQKQKAMCQIYAILIIKTQNWLIYNVLLILNKFQFAKISTAAEKTLK